MLSKLFFWTCIGFLAIAVVIFVTGNATPLIVVTGGFVSFGLVFAGMMCVLPTMVGPHAEAAKEPKTGPSLAKRAGTALKTWSEPKGVEIRNPHYR